MSRNLKSFGLSLIALFAMGTLSASSASAATDVFTVPSSPALVTGTSQNHIFELYPQGTQFKCTTTNYAGTVVNAASTMTVEVTYNGTIGVVPHTSHCTSNIGSATIDTAGCGLEITGHTTGEYSPGFGKDGTVWIECSGGSTIKMTSSAGATLTVPPQTPTKGGVVFTNVSNHSDNTAVMLTTTITGITYSCAPTFTCTLGGIPHHGNNSTTSGNVTLTAYKDVEGLPTPVTEGARIPFSASEA